ncbi:hypothetical protein [Streptococcus gallolyticus]|uniref:Uncharacterized protein n=1 Tax=Streptococcus gallolyticus TaxID=315405 RepID=A0A139R4J6_9STRE|nr:hypothetical protein [Streptococcus gallolyticus]KXT73175.1 hypothetical protein SGADD02_00316 [Streptococcus gallolyticus]KXU09564.1 hypothetical protein SGADD03_00686 [Streptococcus gallolyticus]
MKKSFFQRSYNIVRNLLFFGAISFSFNLVIHLIKKFIDNINIPALYYQIIIVQSRLTIFEHITKNIAVLSILIASLFIILELTLRFMNDSILNYFKSVYQTIRLQQFLKQDENSKSVISIDNQTTVTKYNPILKKFNRTISKSTVDVRKEAIKVCIKYPKIQQAQKLLRDMETHIREEISSRDPNYYFSSSTRAGNKLWLFGTRR